MKDSPSSSSNNAIVVVDAADSKNVLIQCVAPKTGSDVLSALQIKLGAGLLYRSDGYTMLGSDVLQAGEYKYDWQQAPAAAGATDKVPHPSDLAEYVGKLMWRGQAIGSITRILESGLCVTAAHCLVEGGKFLEDATAFEGPLQLVGSSPFHDVMFVQGPPGSAAQLQQGLPVIGQEVAMVGYPLAADQALGTKTQPTTLPVVCRGQVVAVSPTNELVAADYGSALPNASGGAVLLGRQYAGVHVGAFYHLDTSYQAEEEEVPAPTDQWDTDATSMWLGSCRATQAKRRAAGPPVAGQQLNNMALHATSNIPHKALLALFVPVSVVFRLAQQHELMGLTDMDIVQRRHAAHSQR